MTEKLEKPSEISRVDALLPPGMALACEAAGAAKAARDEIALIVLGVLAGAFIAFGAMFMTIIMDRSR